MGTTFSSHCRFLGLTRCNLSWLRSREGGYSSSLSISLPPIPSKKSRKASSSDSGFLVVGVFSQSIGLAARLWQERFNPRWKRGG